MDFIRQVIAFETRVETDYLPGGSQLLWYKLLVLFNRSRWAEWVRVDNRRLMLMAGMNSQNAFLRARDKLVDGGYIEYQKGKKGSPNLYRMTRLYGNGSFNEPKTELQVEPNVELQMELQPEPQVEPIYKQKQETKQKQKQKIICSEQSSEPVMQLPLNDGTEYPVSPEHVQEWAGLYPAVDVIQQLREMRGWLLANPKRRKTRAGVMRFVTGWLSKEQNRGPSRSKQEQTPKKLSYDPDKIEHDSLYNVPVITRRSG